VEAAQKYDAQTGLLYLRARYYAPGIGRFISHDMWSGDANMPMSYNAWLYGYGNPVRYLDPSGMEAYLYNRNEAVAYANRFAKTYNFFQYGIFIGSDCTNFVSQSLKGGGSQEDENWFYSRPGLPTTCSKFPLPFSPSCGNAWAADQLLYNYLTNEKLFSHTDVLGNGFEGGVIPKSPKMIPNNLLAKVREGDVAFYQQDEHGTVFNYAAFVVGWGSVTNAEQNKIFTELPDRDPLVAEHTGAFPDFSPRTINDTRNPIYKMTIVHIPDIIYSPADIWDYVWRCS
jgi:RHS repeat-associated protein